MDLVAGEKLLGLVMNPVAGELLGSIGDLVAGEE